MNAIIITVLWGVILMVTGIFLRRKRSLSLIAISGMILTLAFNLFEFVSGPLLKIDLNGFLAFTSFGLHLNTMIFLIVLLFLLLNRKQIEKAGRHTAEYYSLLFFSLCGVALISAYNSLLALFLGIEVMFVPLYILAGIEAGNLKGNEASIKNFINGFFSSAIFLMGVAFLYGGNSLGSFNINFIQLGSHSVDSWMITGMVLITSSLAYRASLAPFHFWSIDVYDGSASVFSSFMATVVKLSSLYAMIQFLTVVFGSKPEVWQPIVAFLIVISLVTGSIASLFQRSTKRMLGYSAVSQGGFMLLSIYAFNGLGKEAFLLYGAAYCLATIGVFGLISRSSDYTIDGFNGLGKSHPRVSFFTTISLISLTGIPLTAGFMGKASAALSAMNNSQLWLTLFAFICAAISAVSYFRVIHAIYFKEAPEAQEKRFDIDKTFVWILGIIAVLLLLWGIAPDTLTSWIYY